MGPEASLDFTASWLAVSGVLCAVALFGPDSWFQRVPSRPAYRVGGVFAVALLVRFVAAAALQLPDDAAIRFDMDSYRIVGDLVRSGEDVYSQPERYPYLPFQMYWSALAGWLGDEGIVPFLLAAKVPQLLADAGIACLVGLWPGWDGTRQLRGGLVYALNPMTPITAAIHGQFDAVPTFSLVLSVFILLRRPAGDGRALLAGVALGLAVVSKTWPVFTLPLLLWHAGTWRDRALFLLGSSFPVIDSLTVYWAVFGESPYHVFDTIKGYSGVPDAWGYRLALNHLGNADVPGAYWLRDRLHEIDTALLAGTVVVATLLVLRRPLETGMAVVILAFYAAAHGWGFHYLVWAAPFVLVGMPRYATAAYLGVGAVTLWAVFYGYGGVGRQLYEWFDVESAVIRYRWAVGLPMWVLVMVLALAGIAAPWAAGREWAHLRSRRDVAGEGAPGG